MTLSPPVVQGSQQPRLSHTPPSALVDDPDNPGLLAADIADAAGLHLDPWQRLVLKHGLALNAAGKWAAFEVGLIVPRQNGKGSVLEALEIASLFLPEPGGPPPLVLHSAHEFKTSAEHFRRMRDLIEGSPLLKEQVRIIRTAAGSESIELESGARLRFITRSGGSGRGFSADLIVIDEAYNLTAESMAAMLPTMSARPNPQVWYTSSAGMLASEQLARVRSRGVAGTDPRLTFFEWSAPEGSSPYDTDAILQANPAVGIRIPLDFVEAERAALPEEQFARERLGIWAAADSVQVIDPALWSSLTDLDSQPLDPVVFAVAVTPAQDAASIAISGRRSDGVAHVEVIDAREGTGWVVARLEALAAKWRPASIVLDGSGPAGSLLPSLSERGVEVVKATGSDYAVACGAFYDAVQNRQLRHLGDPLLAAKVEAGRKRELAERWAWGRKKGVADITPLEAVTLALWALPAHQTYDVLASFY